LTLDELKQLLKEVKLKICPHTSNQKKKETFTVEQMNSLFTVFGHHYSPENIDEIFRYPLIAKSFYHIREEIRGLIAFETNYPHKNEILNRLITKANACLD